MLDGPLKSAGAYSLRQGGAWPLAPRSGGTRPGAAAVARLLDNRGTDRCLSFERAARNVGISLQRTGVNTRPVVAPRWHRICFSPGSGRIVLLTVVEVCNARKAHIREGERWQFT